MKNLEVSEVYGPVLQGEGRNLGLPSIFLRTQFCPVGCSWCDSQYTWEKKPDLAKTDEEVLDLVRLHSKGVKHVVFTGGEPFAQGEAVARVTQLLRDNGYTIEFETSGTYMPHATQPVGLPVDPNLQYNVSPKPPSANTKVPTNSTAVEWFLRHDSSFKFVCNGEDDLGWIGAFVRNHNIPEERVYVMPQGVTDREVKKAMMYLWERLPLVLPKARVTPRLHVQLFSGMQRRI